MTSPNGQLDAVLVQDSYGGAVGGGIESDVYIVRKGAPISSDKTRKVLQAEPFSGGKLIWKQDHLLEIQFDVARVEHFRNVWGLWEVEDVGSTGQHDFEVEIRLEPLSRDFSILTPDGSYRHTLTDDPVDVAIKRLSAVEKFAFGGVGFAGVTSKGEIDFKFVLSQPEPVALTAFEKLYGIGNPQGKSYALAGIKKLNPSRFRELLATARGSTEQVAVMRGCIVSRESLGDTAKQIDHRKFIF